MLRSLSIIVPAFNEEGRLSESLDKLLIWVSEVSGAACNLFEIVVVDDGSTDGTAALIEGMSVSQPTIRLLRNGENRGKGYSGTTRNAEYDRRMVLGHGRRFIGPNRRGKETLRSGRANKLADSDRGILFSTHSFLQLSSR